MSENRFGADRNGEIKEFSEGRWEVYCGECGYVFSNPFHSYQEASIWFTWHLENSCSPAHIFSSEQDDVLTRGI